MALIEMTGITKVYRMGEEDVQALRDWARTRAVPASLPDPKMTARQ